METTPCAPAEWLDKSGQHHLEHNMTDDPSTTMHDNYNNKNHKNNNINRGNDTPHATQTQLNKTTKTVTWQDPVITPPQQKQTQTMDHTATPDAYNTVQSKYQKTFQGRMRPHPSVCHHPAYPTLLEYATNGCPVDCGESWTIDMLTAAIARGNHASANAPDAARCLREEAMEKVHQGYARIVKWEDIAQDPHPNLKISPLAAVPHKSCIYRAILDLSFQLRVGKLKLTSVNGATTPHSLHHSMAQMGKVLPRLVYQVARTDPNLGPIYFAKWDIKDGFWRLVVSLENAWHFCYVLPKLNKDDPTEIVVPMCLQMGWCESPPPCSAQRPRWHET